MFVILFKIKIIPAQRMVGILIVLISTLLVCIMHVLSVWGYYMFFLLGMVSPLLGWTWVHRAYEQRKKRRRRRSSSYRSRHTSKSEDEGGECVLVD